MSLFSGTSYHASAGYASNLHACGSFEFRVQSLEFNVRVRGIEKQMSEMGCIAAPTLEIARLGPSSCGQNTELETLNPKLATALPLTFPLIMMLEVQGTILLTR